MTFSFITLFPSMIEGYFHDSILGIARKKGLFSVRMIQLRDFATNTYKSVDAKPVSGGAGQVLLLDVLERAITHAKAHHKMHAKQASPNSNSTAFTRTSNAQYLSNHLTSHVIFLTPCAKRFTQTDAIRLATMEHIIFVCGRYEGVDERAIELYADEVFCVGDFILTGGELAALCLCDSIARHIPHVLGNSNSLQEESFEHDLLEAPVFARTSMAAPLAPISEYSKGNHHKIALLKRQLAICKTRYFRPDLFERWRTQEKLHQRLQHEK